MVFRFASGPCAPAWQRSTGRMHLATWETVVITSKQVESYKENGHHRRGERGGSGHAHAVKSVVAELIARREADHAQ